MTASLLDCIESLQFLGLLNRGRPLSSILFFIFSLLMAISHIQKQREDSYRCTLFSISSIIFRIDKEIARGNSWTSLVESNRIERENTYFVHYQVHWIHDPIFRRGLRFGMKEEIERITEYAFLFSKGLSLSDASILHTKQIMLCFGNSEEMYLSLLHFSNGQECLHSNISSF